jgi:endonuclease YncB( thermonuclease family)
MVWKSGTQAYLFWGCIALLLGASLFYGVSVEQVRRSVTKGGGKIDSGSIVSLVRVIDGDTVLVAQSDQQPVLVRILGIKAFDASIAKDVAAPYGQATIDTLSRSLQDRPIRVLLHATPKDRHGRYIAMLYVEDQDIGLRLVKDGLVPVYTVYPFPAMSLYLQEQDLARAGRRGFWANDEVTTRALALLNEWRGRTQ